MDLVFINGDEETNDLIVKASETLELFEARIVDRHLENDVIAFVHVVNRARKLFDTLLLDIANGRFVVGEDLVELLNFRFAGGFIQPSIEDVHELVFSHSVCTS